MPVRGVVRRPTPVGVATSTHAPVYVDSDDNRLKMIPAGSGSTEVILQEAGGAGSVETLLVARTLTAVDSGKHFFLSAAAGFAVTLPALLAGLRFSFTVITAPTSVGYTIVAPGVEQTIVGGVHDAGGAAGDVESTAGATTITMVANQSVVGDRVEMICDGTLWYARVFVNVAAGATFTG